MVYFEGYFVFYHLFFNFVVKNMNTMKLRVKELLKEQGRTMVDLAAELDVDQSNLTKSLEGNPKLSRLNDIAKALGVPLRELFPEAPLSRPPGVLYMGSKRYALTPLPDIPLSKQYNPHYGHAELVREMYSFMWDCFRNNRPAALCGLFRSCAFSFTYDEVRQLHTLVLHVPNTGNMVITYPSYVGEVEGLIVDDDAFEELANSVVSKMNELLTGVVAYGD